MWMTVLKQKHLHQYKKHTKISLSYIIRGTFAKMNVTKRTSECNELCELVCVSWAKVPSDILDSDDTQGLQTCKTGVSEQKQISSKVSCWPASRFWLHRLKWHSKFSLTISYRENFSDKFCFCLSEISIVFICLRNLRLGNMLLAKYVFDCYKAFIITP